MTSLTKLPSWFSSGLHFLCASSDTGAWAIFRSLVTLWILWKQLTTRSILAIQVLLSLISLFLCSSLESSSSAFFSSPIQPVHASVSVAAWTKKKRMKLMRNWALTTNVFQPVIVSAGTVKKSTMLASLVSRPSMTMFSSWSELQGLMTKSLRMHSTMKYCQILDMLLHSSTARLKSVTLMRRSKCPTWSREFSSLETLTWVKETSALTCARHNPLLSSRKKLWTRSRSDPLTLAPVPTIENGYSETYSSSVFTLNNRL